MAYTRRLTDKDATWARAWTADALADLADISAIGGTAGPRHGDIAYVTAVAAYFLWMDDNTWQQVSPLQEHDHTSAAGDGGVLTNDEHDGYSDYIAISDPGTPDTDHKRLWVMDFHSKLFFVATGPDDKSLRLTRDNVVVVKNLTGSQIDQGQPVYINGSSGNVPTVDLADASSDATMPALGLAFEDIADNGFGRVMIWGVLNFNTSAFMDGDLLYISDTTPGDLVATPPVSPSLIQRIAIVTNAGPGNSGQVVVTQTSVKGPVDLAADVINVLPEANGGTGTDISDSPTSFTPDDASGAALTFAAASGSYFRMGAFVFFTLQVTYPATADGSDAIIGNLPFSAGGDDWSVSVGLTDVALQAYVLNGTDTIVLTNLGAARTNADLSGATVMISGTYMVS